MDKHEALNFISTFVHEMLDVLHIDLAKPHFDEAIRVLSEDCSSSQEYDFYTIRRGNSVVEGIFPTEAQAREYLAKHPLTYTYSEFDFATGMVSYQISPCIEISREAYESFDECPIDHRHYLVYGETWTKVDERKELYGE